jgi:hypothetical protein
VVTSQDVMLSVTPQVIREQPTTMSLPTDWTIFPRVVVGSRVLWSIRPSKYKEYAGTQVRTLHVTFPLRTNVLATRFGQPPAPAIQIYSKGSCF